MFASIANYLSSVGWRDDITWGREVIVPASVDGAALSKSKTQKTMAQWKALGLTSLGGEPLCLNAISARVWLCQLMAVAAPFWPIVIMTIF